MKKLIFNLVILLVFLSCKGRQDTTSTIYPVQIGDIALEKLDDPNFKVCNEMSIPQYYSLDNIKVEGEKPTIINFFKENYSSVNLENGYVTIRFIVNCNGKTGRFRVQEMDFDYNPKEFDRRLINRLLQLTKDFDYWQPVLYKEEFLDYYYYLTFKIVNGEIKQIRP